MFSFKKIMIVMLAALILGGGMISMSMHAMELQDEEVLQDQPVLQNQQLDPATILQNQQIAHARRQEQQQRWETIKSVGKNAAALIAMAIIVTAAVRCGAKALYEGFNAPLFINTAPQYVQQAHKHGDSVAHELSTASLLGVVGFYVAKWLS